jgi:site-specific DNA-methyltransferase (cytosine-N4-specific)
MKLAKASARSVVPRRDDTRLIQAIEERAGDDPNFWAFANAERARGARELYQYPAMMVSPMQGELLDVIAQHRGGSPRVTDPFVGSGTTLGEAMRLGLDFTGVDINALAILICQVKARGATGLDLAAAIDAVVANRRAKGPMSLLRDPWTARWYRPDVAAGLGALHAAIRRVDDIHVRRFLWISLAEVARTTGHMRLSTPKLQRREASGLVRPIDVAGAFATVARRNLEELERHTGELRDLGRLTRRGRYRGEVRLLRGDVRDLEPRRLAADVVLTSPPYGDNQTTMPYGQQSFLPLKWTDPNDIDPRLDPALLESARRLDGRSLGGSRRIKEDAIKDVCERSPTLARTVKKLAQARDPRLRVSSFFADLDGALDRVVAGAAPNAHLVLTLGDRTVARSCVANAAIVTELLESRDCHLVTTLERPLRRNKRMATRNEYAETIRSETVLIMRR